MKKLKNSIVALIVLLILLSLTPDDLSLMKLTLVSMFIIWVLFSDKLLEFWND